MAQTVATQRGTGSGVTDTNYTLFTQSGGLGTRVILNQMTLYASGGMNYPYFWLIHTSSTGGKSIIGYARIGNSVGRSFNWFPSGNGSGPMLTNAITSGVDSTGMAWSANAGVYLPDTSNVNYQWGTSNYYSFMPQNYWIGASDSITFRFNDPSSNTVTYAFSFTTITES